jgi:hypothetical protein
MCATTIPHKGRWPSSPRRHATRVVRHDAHRHALARAQAPARPAATSTQTQAATLPPEGPSNIIVRTASPLAPPRDVRSQ